MANYTERFKITLNSSVKEIAAKVGKGFDPDTAGEYSFNDNGDGTISTSTPCTPEFKRDGEMLMTDATLLYYAMQQKYSERWADLTPPTLEECSLFIAAIIPEVEIPLSNNPILI